MLYNSHSISVLSTPGQIIYVSIRSFEEMSPNQRPPCVVAKEHLVSCAVSDRGDSSIDRARERGNFNDFKWLRVTGDRRSRTRVKMSTSQHKHAKLLFLKLSII